jgi:hypothetical protein
MEGSKGTTMHTAETDDSFSSKDQPEKSEEFDDLEQDNESVQDGSGSGNGSESDSVSGTGSNHTRTSGNDEFANKNTDRAICCSKVVFFLVLISAAAALASVVYVVLSQEQQDNFEEKVRMDMYY